MEIEVIDPVEGPVSPHIDHQRASGLLTPSPSLNGSISSGEDDDDAGFNVDYDQAYRMLAVTLGLENSRDATSLASQTHNTAGQYSTAGGVGGTAKLPRDQQPIPSPHSPPMTNLPGVHVFNNATPTVPVTMPTPNSPTHQQQGTLPSPSPAHHGLPQFIPPAMRNQGNIFPPPNQMMQNGYHSNNSYYGNAGNVNMANSENHANNLAALFRSFLQNGGTMNNNGSNLSSMFGGLPEQIIMENMMNFNQNNQNCNLQQQGPAKKQVGHRNYKRGRAPSAPNVGGYNIQQPPPHGHHGISQQQPPPPPGSTPWGFYINRDMDYSATFPYPQQTPVSSGPVTG